MKNIILLLIVLSMPIAFSAIRLDIRNSDNQNMSKVFNTEGEMNTYISKFKKKWGEEAGWKRKKCSDLAPTRTVKGDFGEDILEYDCPATYRLSQTDISQQIQIDAIDDAIDVKMRCGKKVIKFIARNNVMKGLKADGIKKMAKIYALVLNLLSAGAIDTARLEINAMTPDASILTAVDKANILLEIDKCN